MQATHIRLKNNVKVNVERFEGNILVVRNMKGKVIGSYEPTTMKNFYNRYMSILTKGKRG